MSTLRKIFQAVGLMILIGSTASAENASALIHANLTTHNISGSLNNYIKHQKSGWFAYSIPVTKNTRSMCCFNRGDRSICDLNASHNGYGSTSEVPYTDNVHFFISMKKGQIKQIMPVGDHCQVKASGTSVDWLTDVNQQQSIQWLKTLVPASSNADDNGRLYALSLHSDQAAAKILYDIAKNPTNKRIGSEYSENAVFWLGQRQQDGFQYLKSLYQDLPTGEVRRKVNFALSQNQSDEAVNLLKSIAQHDQDIEQQADAIFWLSQTDQVEGLPVFLVDFINASNHHEVKEKAIFSLSQINNTQANKALMKLVTDHDDEEVREKALFWLAQNSPQKAKKAALNLLDSDYNQSDQENAVFILSQLPSKESSQALFDIIKGDYSRSIKKKALFWLSQSDDSSVLSQLEDLL